MTGEKKILRATAAGGTSSGSAAVAGTGTDTYRERTQKPVETGKIKRKWVVRVGTKEDDKWSVGNV